MTIFKRILELIFNVGMYVNPLSLAPQAYKIWNTESALNVSLSTWIIFFIFQSAICLHAKFNLKSRSMFRGMGASAIVSLTVLILCFVYQ